MSILEIKNCNKKINNNKILNNINISFNLGEFVCIIGPSGCGKTSLLKILGLIDDQFEGQLFFNDKRITKSKTWKYRKQYFGFIFQNDNLIDYYKIKDNFFDYKIEEVEEKCNTFNCSKFLDCFPEELSGGEKQKISFIRTIIKKPRIIIADEPTGSLDFNNSEKLIKELKELSKSKLVIMATHNVALAKKYASRIITIGDGSIIEDKRITNNNTNIKIDEIDVNYCRENVLKKTIHFLKSIPNIIFAIIIIVSTVLTVFNISLSIQNSTYIYKNNIYNERLESNYIEMSTYSNGDLVKNSELIENKFKYYNLQYHKLYNYTFLFNNFLINDIIEENEIDFQFNVFIVSFPGKSYNILINSQFFDNYQDNKINLIKEINLFGQTIKFDINEEIDEINYESDIGNTPKIYFNYDFIDNYFSNEIKDYLFNNQEIPIPDLYLLDSEPKALLNAFNSDDEISNSIESSINNKYNTIIFDSTIYLIENSIIPLTESLSLYALIFSIILLFLTISLLFYINRDLIIKRRKEIALNYCNGMNKTKIFQMIFCQNLIMLFVPFIVSSISYFLLTKFIPNKMFGLTNIKNLFIFDYKIIIVSLIVIIIISLLNSIKTITKKEIFSSLETLRNE